MLAKVTTGPTEPPKSLIGYVGWGDKSWVNSQTSGLSNWVAGFPANTENSNSRGEGRVGINTPC